MLKYPALGLKAYVVDQKGHLGCAVGFSAAWVLVGGANGNCRYAQSGMLYEVDGTNDATNGQLILRSFAQYNNCSTLKTYYGPINAGNYQIRYGVLYDSTCSCLMMSLNNGNLWATNFNPYTAGWNTPFEIQFMGETSSYDDGMPGTPTLQTAFSGLDAQRATDDVLIPMPCSLSYENPRTDLWGMRVVKSCAAFNIWTK